MSILRKIRKAVFKFKPFSKKQTKILTWWLPTSPVKDYEGIIADGAIRSGKTLSMSLSFVMWAMESFDLQNFGMCGKTIGSFRRNVLFWLKLMLKARGYKVKDQRADNLVIVTKGDKTNYFYVFGGKDERSQDLIQGITLAGVFFDEVALMPQSFVSQAMGRCSVDGSKYWFNCNPASPYHWFKVEFIDKAGDKKFLHLHFTMDDNLSLSEKVKDRYRRMFSGIFYKRYILGLWVMAEGVIYDLFNPEIHSVVTEDRAYSQYHVAIDYGTSNPTTFGLWGFYNGIWYKVKEYHYDGRKTMRQKTDEEYYEDLEEFVGPLSPDSIIVDPSAASFIAAINKRGRFYVNHADNDVVDGIRNVATAIMKQMILYNDCCMETFREFSSYSWDVKAQQRGEDKPIKQNDHQMDADRYFVNTIVFTPEMKYSAERLAGW